MDEGLQKLIGVSPNSWKWGGEDGLDADVAVVSLSFMHLQSALKESADIDQDLLRGVLLREAEQIGDEIAGAARLLTDLFGDGSLLAFRFLGRE